MPLLAQTLLLFLGAFGIGLLMGAGIWRNRA